MFSFFKKVVSSVVPWNSAERNDIEEERMIIRRIQESNAYTEGVLPCETIEERRLLGQIDIADINVETFKFVHRKGKVTHLGFEYGLIDGGVYFIRSQVLSGLVLKVGDEVLYSAYRAKENETERVYRIYALNNDAWNPANDPGSDKSKDSEDVRAILRIITGRVTQRRGREVFVDSANLWCSLDKIEASYIPVEGDWVELQAAVAVDEENTNWTGDILEVRSLKPLLTKNGFGRVTFWSEAKNEGAIENLIYFTNISCDDGYIPALGDEVMYDAVESDQERFKWRALKVLVHNKPRKENISGSNMEPSAKAIQDPFGDKNGITIVPSVCCVEVPLYETKVVTFEVINNGTSKQLLKYTRFQKNEKSQLMLLKPKLDDYFFIPPKESVLYEFECRGKLLGLTGEIFHFYFRNFKITKRFEINVVSNKEMNKFLESKFDTVYSVFQHKEPMISDFESNVVMYGPKPWRKPKFVSTQRKCVFNIPKNLWNITKGNVRSLRNVKAVTNYAPYLNRSMCFDDYADRFHTLLYLEEMDLKLNFRKYDMEDTCLTEVEDYLVLKVPGLVEKRPSLMVGDKVIVTQFWSERDKIKQVGYIHDIEEKKVYIKFHESFHNSYDGSQCNVTFEPNTNFFSRCHEAINRAVKVLGKEWLFPSAVNEKPPQVSFDIPEESETLHESVKKFLKDFAKTQPDNIDVRHICNLREVEDNMKGMCIKSEIKSLTWANKNLNERQKLAVVNVLTGRGRPLPYIIFGPPGTGKTVTLVEIIIQIYRMIPESRILVTTPSNSAADLLCERLIELEGLKPGQLVRLIAQYRVQEGLVPVKLIPYTTFFNRNDRYERKQSEPNSNALIRGSSLDELTGTHRITVSTCVNTGILHYSGITPGHFTHILVDEAGQTSEPEVLITTSFQNIKTGQVVLAGDPQQLGPVVCSTIARTFGLGTSLLQRLISTFPYCKDIGGFPDTSGFDPRFITQLNVNYRCVPEILTLPSKMFYNSDLISMVSQTEGEEADIIRRCNFKLHPGKDTPSSFIFHGIIGQNYQEKDSPSWFNPHEIWQVVFYIRKLYSLGLNCDQIGVVSPYAKQAQKLKELLTCLGMSLPKIASVEEFQGQERHVIIVSTVRSSPRHVTCDVTHSLGFVASPQRLNVALTRARALLIIIGNPLLLSKDPYWVTVVRYCVENKSYTGCNLALCDSIKDLGKASETDESEEEDVDVPEES